MLAAYVDALRVVGNPSSIHSQRSGRPASCSRPAREQVAASLGADPVEVVFTGGGTEAVNLGIKGLFWARNPSAIAAVETTRIIVPRGRTPRHHRLRRVARRARGRDPRLDRGRRLGRIRLDALEAALAIGGDDVALVTAIWANNEVGTIQPVADIVAVATRYGVPVHLDAIAAYGSLPIDFRASGAAALSVSAHKIGGPVGIGALLVSRSTTVEPLLHGGNQQRARSGTQDAAGAVAFGLAAELAAAELPEHAARLASLRDRLVAGIRSSVPGAVLRGRSRDASAGRLPGNAHFTFEGCEGDSLLFLLDAAGFSVSTGSACQAGVPEASHVLLAMGLSEEDARGALRFTLGNDTTASDIDALLAVLPAVVTQARAAGLAARTPTLGR